jgi:hypothetical protein
MITQPIINGIMKALAAQPEMRDVNTQPVHISKHNNNPRRQAWRIKGQVKYGPIAK